MRTKEELQRIIRGYSIIFVTLGFLAFPLLILAYKELEHPTLLGFFWTSVISTTYLVTFVFIVCQTRRAEKELSILNQNPSVEKKKIGEHNVLVFTDNTKNFIITLDGPGGPMVMEDNYAKAEEKFIEAMNLAQSIKKLLHFKENGEFPKS